MLNMQFLRQSKIYFFKEFIYLLRRHVISYKKNKNTVYQQTLYLLLQCIFSIKQRHFESMLPSFTLILKQISSFILSFLKNKIKINAPQVKVYLVTCFAQRSDFKKKKYKFTVMPQTNLNISFCFPVHVQPQSGCHWLSLQDFLIFPVLLTELQAFYYKIQPLLQAYISEI